MHRPTLARREPSVLAETLSNRFDAANNSAFFLTGHFNRRPLDRLMRRAHVCAGFVIPELSSTHVSCSKASASCGRLRTSARPRTFVVGQ